MKSKLLAGAAALFLTGCTVLATSAPASAAPRWHHGFWPGAVAAGVISGAVAAATSPLWAPGYYDYYPGYGPGPYYDYVPAAPVAGANVAWCQAHFRSYNPGTGTYLGFDGQYHSCP
ncbi:MAG: BA14K family protein [Xanthobacteraceae bacterium]